MDIKSKIQKWFRPNERNGFHISTFLLFVLLAFVLWYGHAFNSVRERAVSIAVVYTGVPDEVNFDRKLPKTFNIKVRDAGKRLRQYRSSHFQPVEINLHDQLHETEGVVVITSEMVRTKITDQLQGTTKLQRIEPENLQIGYYREKHKTVPLCLKTTLQAEAQHQFIEQPTLTPDSIIVFGKEDLLASIDTVFVEEPKKTIVKDSLAEQVDILLPEGIRGNIEKTRLTAKVELFTEKTFLLPVVIKGVPHGERLRIFPPEVTLKVRVGVSHFADLSEADFLVSGKYPKAGQTAITLEATTRSEYATHLRLSPSTVEFLIENE